MNQRDVLATIGWWGDEDSRPALRRAARCLEEEIAPAPVVFDDDRDDRRITRALADLGEGTAAAIASRTGLEKRRVISRLHSLRRYGLVDVVHHGVGHPAGFVLPPSGGSHGTR